MSAMASLPSSYKEMRIPLRTASESGVAQQKYNASNVRNLNFLVVTLRKVQRGKINFNDIFTSIHNQYKNLTKLLFIYLFLVLSL